MQAYSLSRILNDARQLTRSARISLAEVLFVFSHTQLNEVEKILWILFATHADDSLSCTFSYAQISYCVNLDHEIVHRALKRLLALGFLECEGGLPDPFSPLCLLKFQRFHLALPLEGLLALKKAPQCKKPKPWHEKGIYKRPPILINLLNNRFNI
ncbi:MAG: hypothetical protein AB7I18_02760 [Candidatus Berkiella sp.]